MQLRVPRTNRNLATIYNEIGNSKVSIQLWGPSFEMHAPQSMPKIESLIGLTLTNPSIVPRLPSDELLSTLTQAYREANGLPLGGEVAE